MKQNVIMLAHLLDGFNTLCFEMQEAYSDHAMRPSDRPSVSSVYP